MATVETIEVDEGFAASVRVVELIDEHLEKGTRHFWHISGQRLTHLGEVVWAILNDELMTDKDVQAVNSE